MASRLRNGLIGIIALLAGLVPAVADAATLYISEYSNIGAIGSSPTPWPPGPALATQTVAVGAGSVSSAAFNGQTKAVLLTCDIGCSISFGTSPTATTSTTLLQQGVPYYFVTSPSQKVATIANPSGDTGGGSGTATNVNLEQVGGVATAVGNGTTNTGTQRVTISSDSTGTVIATQATAASLNAQVVGNVASDATDSGNPSKVAGVVSTTAPSAATSGQRKNLWVTANGATVMGAVATTGGDGVNNGNMSTYANLAGTSATQLLVAPSTFNGTTWDRAFTCTSSAVINATAAATTQLVALSGSTVIRVCGFTLTESLAGTAQFVYGTGSNCGTGTTNLTGAMALATSGVMTVSAGTGSVFRTIAANALCLTAVTGNITGFVTYAQY